MSKISYWKEIKEKRGHINPKQFNKRHHILKKILHGNMRDWIWEVTWVKGELIKID